MPPRIVVVGGGFGGLDDPERRELHLHDDLGVVVGWLAWNPWALAYLFQIAGPREQFEVSTDCVKGLFVRRDTSQIHERRRMLRDPDLDPTLGPPPRS